MRLVLVKLASRKFENSKISSRYSKIFDDEIYPIFNPTCFEHGVDSYPSHELYVRLLKFIFGF